MATTVTPLIVTRDGVADPVSPATGDTAYAVEDNDGNVLIRFTAGAADTTVTAVPSATMVEFSVTGNPVVVPAAETVTLGPYPPAIFGATLNLTVDQTDATLFALGI